MFSYILNNANEMIFWYHLSVFYDKFSWLFESRHRHFHGNVKIRKARCFNTESIWHVKELRQLCIVTEILVLLVHAGTFSFVAMCSVRTAIRTVRNWLQAQPAGFCPWPYQGFYRLKSDDVCELTRCVLRRTHASATWVTASEAIPDAYHDCS
jgi:hypothetical protein